jgi:AhpD family alkylhydroperoxidase
MQPIQGLMAATRKGGVEPRTLGLVHLRASQINGCSACVESGVQHAKQGGDTDQRLIAVAAWRRLSPGIGRCRSRIVLLAQRVG